MFWILLVWYSAKSAEQRYAWMVSLTIAFRANHLQCKRQFLCWVGRCISQRVVKIREQALAFRTKLLRAFASDGINGRSLLWQSTLLKKLRRPICSRSIVRQGDSYPHIDTELCFHSARVFSGWFCLVWSGTEWILLGIVGAFVQHFLRQLCDIIPCNQVKCDNHCAEHAGKLSQIRLLPYFYNWRRRPLLLKDASTSQNQ